jgi:hypothetical protein
MLKKKTREPNSAHVEGLRLLRLIPLRGTQSRSEVSELIHH